jgi:tetratricopeptide (TPR) repeat protein
MGEASQAFDENQLDVAAAKYRAALAMRPRSPEALNGLAGLLTKNQQYSSAAGVYEQLLKAQPRSADGWRGLFLAYARDGQNQKAIAVSARFPAPVRAAMAKDPEYLRTLATIYQAENRPADAQRALAQALSLPFPDNGTNLKADTRLQYAGVLMEAKRYSQAAELYTQILNEDAGNLSAWEGLVSAHHELGQDTQAIADVEKMPPATYETALADSGFLSLLGSIYAQANQYEIAQGLLERSAKLQIAAGGQPGIPLQLQLAAIYLQRNNTAQAYAIYHQILVAHPDRTDAWKGLISTLLVTNHNTEALAEIALIPTAVRKQLETDIEFVQAEASVYAATGDIAHAVEYMNRVEAHYATLKMQAPANIEVQNAWLLFNTKNDRALYPALMRLGSRKDLTIAQREAVQTIWANWSVRRAGTAIDNGNPQRAGDILDAALQAFPNNLAVRKAVAGGYVRIGRAKESLTLYKSIPMQDATVGDYQGAVGAALAANDKAQAEIWLRQALDRYPRDAAILAEAARYEQARGDNQRAADYWRASLAAMPHSSPVDKLAHELAYPDQDPRAHRAVTAADLQRLLDPNNEPFAKTTKLPPLPAYGQDPYNGGAPVVLTRPQQVPQQDQFITAPASTVTPLTSVPASSLQVTGVPMAEAPAPSQPLYGQQNATQTADDELPVPRQSSSRSRSRTPSDLRNYEGVMHLPNGGNIRSPRAASSMNETQVAGLTPQSSLAQALDPEQTNGQAEPRVPTVALSPTAEAWKGLIFSLIAGNRIPEAFQQIAQMPPDVRHQLDGDVEFMQGMAGLYVAKGDIPRATEYLNRVENYYLLRRTAPPAGIAVQNAWLLYNTGKDHDLYPALKSLDARQDLTSEQRVQVETIWANWSMRRATAAMDSGNTALGVEILEAAAQQFPDNLSIRRAMASSYVKAGRASESLAIFKATTMQGATAGDFQGAIGAAMTAKDMVQAEAWLRQALARFPRDPAILAQAARFEQARGNNERATDFWRASLAAMPPGSPARRVDSLGVYPQEEAGVQRGAAPGDLKQLLDPDNQASPSANRLPPLPAYGSSPYNQSTPGVLNQPVAPVQQNSPQIPWNTGPAADLLPLPGAPLSNSAPRDVSASQAQNPSSVPVYIPQPQNGVQGTAQSQPVFVEQSANRLAVMQPVSSRPQADQHGRGATKSKNSSNANSYAGRMQIAASEETIDSVGAAESQTPRDTNPGGGLRITSQPMDSAAARAQAFFAEQTDSQLTQGSAMAIHTLPNAQVDLSGGVSGRQTPGLGAAPSGAGHYKMAQYTPSAQEAATGAYSAPKQQTTPQLMPDQQPTQQPIQQQAQPTARQLRKQAKRARRAAHSNLQAAPTLASAPAYQEPDQQQMIETPAPVTPSTTGAGLTDEELQERNLPPLRGPWVRVQRDVRAPSPRDEAEMQLRSIESGYSAWLGGSGIINYRSGDLGYDHLSALEAPFEVSMPLGYNARLTIVAKPVFLDSGQADGNSVITVQEATTSGTSLVQIPQPLGTDTTTNGPAISTGGGIPPQQNAAGIGGELQLSFPHLSIAGGVTPYGFLVNTFTGRFQWKPGNGPFTFNFIRDSIKDTQLSYAGLRDPGSSSLSFPGNIWGGVISNQGGVQYSRGDAESGFYLGLGGQYLTGYKVENNIRIDGSGGAYWRLLTKPEYGNLSIGANFFGMHYSHNESAFTYGMGGYFSPQAYFLANVPFTWVGHSGTRWHYNILGSLGVQAFQLDLTQLYPNSIATIYLPAKTSVGSNYDLRTQVAYQIGPHWFAGGFLSANNSRDYKAATAGFFVRYLFRAQPSTVAGPTGLFPTDGLRPFTVP